MFTAIGRLFLLASHKEHTNATMSAHKTNWYVQRCAVDEYKQTLIDDQPIPMLKTLKILRAIIVNLGIMTLSGFFVLEGGDPTIIGVLSLAVLGGYNGLELTDYLALVQAVQEVKTEK